MVFNGLRRFEMVLDGSNSFMWFKMVLSDFKLNITGYQWFEEV